MVSVTQWELSRLVMKCLVPLNGKYTGERRADVHILRGKDSEREKREVLAETTQSIFVFPWGIICLRSVLETAYLEI